MIATRYAAVTACLIALALVPTIAHTYMKVEANDGRSVTAIPVTLAGMPSTRTTRTGTWVEHTFNSRDWLERTHRTQDGQRFLLFVARTTDAKKLYHHPELAVLHGQDPRSLGVVRLSRRPDVPIHLLETRSRLASGNGGYVLMFGAQFVSDPVAFQLRNAVRSVFTRPHQMTLLLAYDPGLGTQPFEASPASQLLLEAVTAFEQQRVSGTN